MSIDPAEPHATISGSPEGPPAVVAGRWRRILLRSVLGVVALVVLLVGGLLLRLASGPVSLAPIKGPIVRGLSTALDPLSVTLDDVVLRWGGFRRPLDIHATSVEILDGEGAALIGFDRIGVLVAVRPLLLGRVRPYGIEIIALRVNAVRNEDGIFIFDLGPQSGMEESPAFNELVQRWLEASPGSPLEDLEEVRVSESAVHVEDRSLELEYAVEQLSLRLRRRAKTVSLTGEGTLLAGWLPTVGEPLTAELILDSEMGRSDDAVRINLRATDLVPARLARVGDPRLLGTLDQAVTAVINLSTTRSLDAGTASVEVDEPRVSLKAEADLTAGLSDAAVRWQVSRLDPTAFAGAFDLVLPKDIPGSLQGEGDLTIQGREFRRAGFDVRGTKSPSGFERLHGTVESRGDRLEVAATVTKLEPWRWASLMDSPETLAGIKLSLDGETQFSLAEGALDRLTFDLQSTGGEVTVAGSSLAPLSVGKVRLAGKLDEGMRRARLSSCDLLVSGLAVNCTLQATRSNDGWRSEVGATVGRTSLASVLSLWPADVAGEGRQFVVDSVDEVNILQASVNAQLSLGARKDAEVRVDGLVARFGFDGLRMRLLDPPLAIEAGRGEAVADLDRLQFDIAGGRHGQLELAGSRVVLAGFDRPSPLVDLDLRVAGPLADSLSLLSRQPLEVLPADSVVGITGTVSGRVRMNVDMAKTFVADEVGLMVDASFARVEVPDELFGLAVQGATATLALDGGALSAQGRGTLKGRPVEFRHRSKPFLTEEPYYFDVDGDLDVGAIEEAAPELAGYLKGSAAVKSKIVLFPDGRLGVTADGDVTRLGIDGSLLAVEKKVGESGTLAAKADRAADGAWKVAKLDLASPSTEASVRLDLSPAGELTFLDVAHLRSPATQLKARLESRSGAMMLSASGDRFDARKLIALYKESFGAKEKSTTPLPDVSVDLQFREVRVSDDRARLRDLVISAETRKGALQSFNLDGAFVGGGVIKASFGAKSGVYQAFAHAENLGAVWAAIQGGSEIEGGFVQVSAQGGTPRGPFLGGLEAGGFTLRNASTAFKVLSLASLAGLIETARAEGLLISKLQSDFEVRGPVLKLKETRLWGPRVLSTLDGSLDFEAWRMDINGTVSPGSTVEKVLGKTPIIKWITNGVGGEGVMAAGFRVSGPIDDPKVSVNASSLLTPGITRSIVDAFRGEPKEEGPPPP